MESERGRCPWLKGNTHHKGKLHSEATKQQISKKLEGNKNRWRGDDACAKSGQRRAKKLFGTIKGLDKHHKDGNPLNNDPSNIEWVTRKGHMVEDGRLDSRDEHGRFRGGL